MAKRLQRSTASGNKRLALENALLAKRLELTERTVHNSLGGLAAGLTGDFGGGSAPITSVSPLLQANQYAPITLMYQALQYMYTTHGLLQTAVDMPVLDALRGGLDITSDGQLSADDIGELQDYLEENAVLERVGDAFIWARLFGGGALVINTEGDHGEPLGDEVMDGKVEFYDANRWELICERRIPKSGVYGFYGKELDQSRVLTITGKRAPWLVRAQLSDWGMSELQRVIEDFNVFLRTRNVIYALLDEAKVDVFSLKGFSSALATPKGTELTTRRVQTMNQIKNFNNALIMDKEDEYSQKQLSFSGLAEIMKENRMGLASAFRMPQSKLFGIASTGFSSGEDDLENYIGLVESEVRQPMRQVIRKVLKVVVRHLFKDDLDVKFAFKPLRSLSTMDEETVKTSKSNRYLAMYDKRLMDSREVGEAMQKDAIVPVPLKAEQGLLDEHPETQEAVALPQGGEAEAGVAETASDEQAKGDLPTKDKPLELPKDSGSGKPTKPEAPEKPAKPKLNLRNGEAAPKLFLRFDGKSYPVSSVAEAQDKWGQVRDAAIAQGMGSSDLEEQPLVVDSNGRRLHALSWNGNLLNESTGTEHE